jgi:hypothetical protein
LWGLFVFVDRGGLDAEPCSTNAAAQPQVSEEQLAASQSLSPSQKKTKRPSSRGPFFKVRISCL